jgi:anaerobic ribonucleoside-triphosphate reductase activating protein
MNRSMLNLAALCRKTSTLGPGCRAVLWVQGCPFRCKGCISPEWIPFTQVDVYGPHTLAEELLADPQITGITISGGEPVTQASALTNFLEYGKSIRDIDVILFTGYYYENLLAFPATAPVQQLLQLVDVLIDGPYDENQNNNLGLRGSINQRIIHLTDRLKDYDFEHQIRQVEIQISNGEILFVGVPPIGVLPGVLASLEIDMNVKTLGGRYEWT